MASKDYNKELLKIVKAFKSIESFVNSKDGQIIDLKKVETFTQGPYLHQDTKDMSEEESAQHERDNPELFRFFKSFEKDINDILKRFLRE